MTPDCTNRVTTVVDMNDYLALEAERDEALQQRDEARALLREVQACEVLYGQRETWEIALPDRLCRAIRAALVEAV